MIPANCIRKNSNFALEHKQMKTTSCIQIYVFFKYIISDLYRGLPSGIITQTLLSLIDKNKLEKFDLLQLSHEIFRSKSHRIFSNFRVHVWRLYINSTCTSSFVMVSSWEFCENGENNPCWDENPCENDCCDCCSCCCDLSCSGAWHFPTMDEDSGPLGPAFDLLFNSLQRQKN